MFLCRLVLSIVALGVLLCRSCNPLCSSAQPADLEYRRTRTGDLYDTHLEMVIGSLGRSDQPRCGGSGQESIVASGLSIWRGSIQCSLRCAARRPLLEPQTKQIVLSPPPSVA